MDGVNDVLLVPASTAHDEEQSRRTVRDGRMRLWDGRPPARGPSLLDEAFNVEDDYPVAHDNE